VGALSQFVEALGYDGTPRLVKQLQILQKRLKYGLPTKESILIYESGFVDRVISQDIARNIDIHSGRNISTILRKNRDIVETLLEKYPIYYQKKFWNIISE
jgi:adenylate kinase family enzyme